MMLFEYKCLYNNGQKTKWLIQITENYSCGSDQLRACLWSRIIRVEDKGDTDLQFFDGLKFTTNGKISILVRSNLDYP